MENREVRMVKLEIANQICGFSDSVHHGLLRLYVAHDHMQILDMNVGVSKIITDIDKYFPDNWLVDLNDACEELSITILNPEERVGKQMGSWSGTLRSALINIVAEIKRLENKLIVAEQNIAI